MKKISLILFCIFAVSSIFAQDNLLKDGKFEVADFDVYDVYRRVHPKGEWYPCLFNNRSASIAVVEDDEKGNVVMFQSLSSISWAYSYVAQRIESVPERGVYRVGFWAKSLNNTKPLVTVYIRVNTHHTEELFFTINNFFPEDKPAKSGAHIQRRITDEWEYYEADFDLSKTIDYSGNYKTALDNGNNVNVVASSDKSLEDFFVAISTTTANAQFIFTDVSLTKIK